MPLPRWLARINKRDFNPREIRRGVRPVLILDAHPLPDGYVFIPNYGPRSDWVRNVLAAGTARLSIGGQEIELASPRMVRKGDIWSLLPGTTKTPPGISNDSELLRMDVRGGS